VGLELLDVVENEVIEEDVVGLLLASDMESALGAFVQKDEVLRKTEFAEGVLAESSDGVRQVIVAERTEDGDSLNLAICLSLIGSLFLLGLLGRVFFLFL
jgi:hypothetical protein